MVSLNTIVSSAGATATALILTRVLTLAPPQLPPQSLPVGEFYRPSASESSSLADTEAPYRRSPCPAINILANHGYLPRDGKNISKAEIRTALVDVLNVGPEFADQLLTSVPVDVFDLNLLGTHGLIEHDASLVHDDAFYGLDPMTVNRAMARDILRRGDQVIGVQELGAVRRDRLATCMACNPDCTFEAPQHFLAFGESALLLEVLGAGRNASISKKHFEWLVMDERLPNDFVKAEKAITLTEISATSDAVAAVAMASSVDDGGSAEIRCQYTLFNSSRVVSL